MGCSASRLDGILCSAADHTEDKKQQECKFPELARACWDRKLNGDKALAVDPIESIVWAAGGQPVDCRDDKACWNRKFNGDKVLAVVLIESIV